MHTKIRNIILIIFLITFSSINLFSMEKSNKIDLNFKEKEWIKNNPTVSISFLRNFQPFSYVENNVLKGLTYDVIKRVEELSGLKFHLKESKWSTALEEFKNENIDIISDISKTKKREDFTLFTKPYYEIPTFIFGLKGNNTYKNNDSLKGKKVAVSKGIFYIDDLKKLGIEVIEFNSFKNKIKAVIDGDADYFTSSYTKGINVIRENSLTNLTIIDELTQIKKEDLRFGISPKKPELYSILNKALDQISSREITTLADKWIVFAQESEKYKKIDFTEKELAYIKSNPLLRYSEVNWMPLSVIENNQMKGILGDFLKIVSIRTGLDFKFVPSTSWENILTKFEENKIELIPRIGTSPQEKELGLISYKYSEFPMVIITGQKYSYLNSIDDLKEKVIAVPKYYTSYNFIKKNYPNINLIETTDIAEALLLVENGKADAFVGHIAASIYYISKLQLKDLKISGSTLFNFEHHYLVQKDNQVLLSIINKAIMSITQKEKKEIYSNWIESTVIEKSIDYNVLIATVIIALLIILGFIYRQFLLKKYNRKLEKSYSDIESIINSTMEAIVITESGIIIDANNSALKLFSISKEEILGYDLLDFIAKEDKQTVRKSLLRESTEPFELNIVTSDNKIIPALGRGTKLDLNDKVIKIYSLIDLSEVKSKEKLLIEQSKMAALGEMIGHIAHQWRQPLSIITTLSSSWSIYNEIGKFEKEKVLEDAKQIISNANYLSQTIDDFRSFIKDGEKTKKANIKDLIENLCRLISPSLHSEQVNFIIRNDINKEIVGNQNEILQALINIINNAIDALNQNIKDGEKFLFLEIESLKEHVNISIKDNAMGIPEEIKDKIFEPYFTTKHESNGTGLGLYMSYSIIKKSGGKIDVSNVEYKYNDIKYKGANFLISLECAK